jgi:hypothetical protein
MLSLQVHTIVADAHSSVISVTTKLCRYQVYVEDDAVTISGPGLKHELSREGILSDPDLTPEGAAAMAVIFFEESNQ